MSKFFVKCGPTTQLHPHYIVIKLSNGGVFQSIMAKDGSWHVRLKTDNWYETWVEGSKDTHTSNPKVIVLEF